MSYEPTIWRTGDTVTAEKLNKIEQAIVADNTAIEGKVGRDEFDTEIATLESKVGSPLMASTVSEMTDTDRVYVYTGIETGYTSGNWYYYDGTAWTSGGVYNAVAVETDTTLSVSGKAADAKKVGDELSSLKEDLTYTTGYVFDSYTKTDGKYITKYGTIDTSNGFSYSSPVAVSKDDFLDVYAGGYLAVVAIISTCSADGGDINAVVPCTQTDPKHYTYKVVADGYVCFSWNNSYGISIKHTTKISNQALYDEMTDKDATIMEIMEDLSTNIAARYTLTEGKYVNVTGGTLGTSDFYMCTDYIRCDLYDVYVCTHVDNDYSAIAFYNSDKTFISAYNPYSDNDVLTKLTKPTRATYIRVSCKIAYADSFRVIYGGIADISQTNIQNLNGVVYDVDGSYNFNFPAQNLMPLSAPDITVLDVGFEYSNGVLTPSGTSSGDGGRLWHIIDLPNVKAGTYTISSYQTGTGNYLQLVLHNSSNTILAQFKNNSATFTLDSNDDLFIGATLANGKAYSVPAYINLIEGSTARPTFIDPRKRDVVDVTARDNYTKTVHIMDSNGGITDANDADINRIYLLIDVSNVSHLPESTSGLLITFARDTAAILQVYITSDNSRYWLRRKWGNVSTSWGSWKRIATIDDIPTSFETPLDVLPMFDNITCCGDSLTYSQVYTGESTSRQAKVPYPKVLEKITGTPTTSLATAGYTAINWWNAYHENITAKTNQVAIIYLGTNAGLTDTIDIDAPGTDVANYDKTTNTGAYCAIVKSFIDVGAKVILVKLYTSSGNKDTTNSVIKKIADKFSCGLVESAYLSDNVYHYYPDLSGYNSVHYNDIGYSAFARKLSDNIANMDKDYLKFVIPS